MTKYQAPNGEAIVGTLELIRATCPIDGIAADGTPAYTAWAETEVNWDSQKTVTRNGKIIFLDESRNEWTFDQLTPIEDDADDE
jgi:hypothetical protein